MKRGRTKKSGNKKVWIAGLVGALLIGMSGACGSETESDSVDRSMPAMEEVVEESEDAQVDEEQELVAEVLPTAGAEAGGTREIVPESTATPKPTPEPTATPELTPEPTATPEPTPEPTATPKPTDIPVATAEPEVEKSVTPTGTDYILNTNTYKFHYLSCSSVKQMKEKNKAYFTGTREECISMGYDSCGRCKP